MAIDPSASYPTKVDTTDPGYPLGKARNVSAPGAGDGTPNEAQWLNDLWGFLQALLDHAGAAPSGSPDKVGSSQYLAALQAKFEASFAKGTAFNKNFGLTPADILEIGAAIVASRVLETNASGKVISVVKNTGYNKAVGTIAGTVAAGDDSRFATIVGAFNYTNFLYIEDQKATGVNGGNSTAAAWTKRDLNTTVINNIIGATLSASQVTLPAGTYFIIGECPIGSDDSSYVAKHKARIYNATDLSVIKTGYSQSINDGGSPRAGVVTQLVLGSTKTIELQHYRTDTRTNGFGQAVSDGSIEIYSSLMIFKVG